MYPGDVVVCVSNRILERTLTVGQLYMVLEGPEQQPRDMNFGVPSVLIRSDVGQEIWFYLDRFTLVADR